MRRGKHIYSMLFLGGLGGILPQENIKLWKTVLVVSETTVTEK